MQERHVMVPAIYVVMRRDDGFVLALEREKTGYLDGHWAIPSGHVEKEELPISGAIRETVEEVGVKINESDLRFAHLMIRPAHDETGERVDIFFEAFKWEGEPRNTEPHKHSQVKWVDLNDKSLKWMPYQKHGLNCIDKGISYSEFKD